jgi:hypothetical protein
MRSAAELETSEKSGNRRIENRNRDERHQHKSGTKKK